MIEDLRHKLKDMTKSFEEQKSDTEVRQLTTHIY
jgi:hypothetical protein